MAVTCIPTFTLRCGNQSNWLLEMGLLRSQKKLYHRKSWHGHLNDQVWVNILLCIVKKDCRLPGRRIGARKLSDSICMISSQNRMCGLTTERPHPCISLLINILDRSSFQTDHCFFFWTMVMQFAFLCSSNLWCPYIFISLMSVLPQVGLFIPVYKKLLVFQHA
jgi:hypothetical protein